MKILSLAAGAFAIATVAYLPSASAADLSYKYSNGDRHYQFSIGDKYKDHYEDDYGSRKYRKSYKDYDDYGDFDRKSYKDRYSKKYDKHYDDYAYKRDRKHSRSIFHSIPEARYYGHCLKPRRIHRKLRRQGWYDFHKLRIRNFVFKVKARRDDGLVYRLRVDRCTGDIIRAKPLWNQYRAFRYWQGRRGY